MEEALDEIHITDDEGDVDGEYLEIGDTVGVRWSAATRGLRDSP